MQGRLIPNWLFSSVSWLLLLGAMIVLTAVAREVYQRHIVADPVQRFVFGNAVREIAIQTADLSSVTKRHIFGVVPPVKKPVVEKPKVIEAPKTKLKLSLTGVITAPIAEQSRAMVEIKKGQTGVVKIGEQIGKTGATLDAVFKDHILIEYRGQQEKLEIVRPKMGVSDLRDQTDSTISALNINVAEFEALAKVNPQDLDISRLLPAPPPRETAEVDQAADTTAAAGSNISKTDELILQQMNLQQLAELEELDRREEIEELQQILDEGGLDESEIEELQGELEFLRQQVQ